MKVLISADIEGIAGVFHPEQTRAGNAEYEQARRWMTREANAADRRRVRRAARRKCGSTIRTAAFAT